MPKIKIFSTPSCHYCSTLKQYLTERKIVFEDIDVSRDEKALNEMVEKSEQMGVPVVDIDGAIIIGFDKEKIDELLKLEIKN